jgi:hypothetical protein
MWLANIQQRASKPPMHTEVASKVCITRIAVALILPPYCKCTRMLVRMYDRSPRRARTRASSVGLSGGRGAKIARHAFGWTCAFIRIGRHGRRPLHMAMAMALTRRHWCVAVW